MHTCFFFFFRLETSWWPFDSLSHQCLQMFRKHLAPLSSQLIRTSHAAHSSRSEQTGLAMRPKGQHSWAPPDHQGRELGSTKPPSQSWGMNFLPKMFREDKKSTVRCAGADSESNWTWSCLISHLPFPSSKKRNSVAFLKHLLSEFPATSCSTYRKKTGNASFIHKWGKKSIYAIKVEKP